MKLHAKARQTIARWKMNPTLKIPMFWKFDRFRSISFSLWCQIVFSCKVIWQLTLTKEVCEHHWVFCLSLNVEIRVQDTAVESGSGRFWRWWRWCWRTRTDGSGDGLYCMYVRASKQISVSPSLTDVKGSGGMQTSRQSILNHATGQDWADRQWLAMDKKERSCHCY